MKSFSLYTLIIIVLLTACSKKGILENYDAVQDFAYVKYNHVRPHA